MLVTASLFSLFSCNPTWTIDVTEGWNDTTLQQVGDLTEPGCPICLLFDWRWRQDLSPCMLSSKKKKCKKMQQFFFFFFTYSELSKLSQPQAPRLQLTELKLYDLMFPKVTFMALDLFTAKQTHCSTKIFISYNLRVGMLVLLILVGLQNHTAYGNFSKYMFGFTFFISLKFIYSCFVFM